MASIFIEWMLELDAREAEGCLINHEVILGLSSILEQAEKRLRCDRGRGFRKELRVPRQY